jgi:hypothetical protein
MTNRELLELAAKAAGIVYEIDAGYVWIYEQEFWTCWNPLEDNGDALRLAVNLEIEPKFLTATVQAVVVEDKDGDAWETCLAEETIVKDKVAATRRAIVRAAAEIGKAMK